MSYIIGVPSGEILNCNKDDKYKLYIARLVKRVEYYNGLEINSYVFKDKDIKLVIDIISEDFIMGKSIYHKKFGQGKLAGLIGDNGWIVHFKNNKIYYTMRDLIKNPDIELD